MRLCSVLGIPKMGNKCRFPSCALRMYALLFNQLCGRVCQLVASWQSTKMQSMSQPAKIETRGHSSRRTSRYLLACNYERFFFASTLERIAVPTADFVPVLYLLRSFLLLAHSSARTTAPIFIESTLYRVAARARFESFSSDCLGL